MPIRESKEIVDQREFDCKKLKTQGYTYQQIADKLNIGIHNVNYYLHRKKTTEYSKRYNKKYKERVRTRDIDRYNKRKDNFYKDVNCIVCNDDHLIYFHHTDKDNKLFTIKDAVHCPNKYTEDQISLELDKCVPLCASCHQKLHWGTLKGYKHLWNGKLNQYRGKI